MRMSKQALKELRQLMVVARDLADAAAECERLAPEFPYVIITEIVLSHPMACVLIDLGFLGLQAFIDVDSDVDEWADGFEGALYALDRAVSDAIQRPFNERQKELLIQLDSAVTNIDHWHTKYVAY